MRHLLLRLWRALPASYHLRWTLSWLVSQKFLVGVVGVVFNESGETLLLHHTYRKEIPWGLPSGWLQRGEQPAAALKREIAEEAGLEIQVLSPLAIENDGTFPRLDLVYLCRFTGGQFIPSLEVSEIRFFSPDHLPPLLPQQIQIIQQAVKNQSA